MREINYNTLALIIKEDKVNAFGMIGILMQYLSTYSLRSHCK